MKTTKETIMTTNVNILGGKLFDFIPHCLALQDSGCKTINLNGYGGDANKALVLSQMLNKIGKANSYVVGARISEIKTHHAPLNMISAGLQVQEKNALKGKNDTNNYSTLINKGFVDFSTYHMILSDVLKEKKEIKISIPIPNRQSEDLLIIRTNVDDPGQLEIEIILKEPNDVVFNSTSYPGRLGSTREREEKRSNNQQVFLKRHWKKTQNNLIAALYRTGFLLPEDWEEIGLKLTDYDDVIIGLDTNLLQDAFVTTTLLPVLAVIERQPYLQTPNWLLLVIPKMVIYEIERAANLREDQGELTHYGRRGYRALQEMMELRKNFDQKGVSVVNTGDPDGMQDMNRFLKSINDNLYQLVEKDKSYKSGSRSPKSSSADMIIRTQFKSFVEEFNFGKGAYFMTSDKVNAAMFAAQGNNSIYVSKPHSIKEKVVCAPELIPSVKRTIPLGTLIYELVTEYSELYVHIDGESAVLFESDRKGQSLSPWTKRQLRIPKNNDFLALMKNYTGSFNLVEVQKAYNQISNQLENVNWINDDYADYDDDENDTDELG